MGCPLSHASPSLMSEHLRSKQVRAAVLISSWPHGRDYRGSSTDSPAWQAKLPCMRPLPSLWPWKRQHWLHVYHGLLHGLQSALEGTRVHSHLQHQVLHGACWHSAAPASSLPPGTVALPRPSLGLLLLVAPCRQAGRLLGKGIVVATGPQVLLVVVLSVQGPGQGVQPCMLARDTSRLAHGGHMLPLSESPWLLVPQPRLTLHALALVSKDMLVFLQFTGAESGIEPSMLLNGIFGTQDVAVAACMLTCSSTSVSCT